MTSEIAKVPFFANPQRFFGKDSIRPENSALNKLIKDTKAYIFSPLEDEYESKNQLRLIQIEEQGLGGDIESLYTEISELRKKERAEMIKRGYLDDENSRRSLDNAISFRGTCIDMCPVFERIKRTRQNNVNIHEKDPQTGLISRVRAIKSFARPAAGQEPPLPSDVRPPEVLVRSLDFIVDNLVDQIPDTQSFVWDRTRSIRQDFTFQNYYGPETIDCNERIARIHILSLHIMANSTVEYSQQQELEQLEKSLKTLTEIYDEYRKKGFPQPPNESEFRAYHLILKSRDPELERDCEKLPSKLFRSNYIQTALLIRRIISFSSRENAPNLYTTFFDVVFSSRVPFLIACLLEVKFNEVRLRSLQSIIKCNHSKTKQLELIHLCDVLRFPDYNHLKQFLEFYYVKWVTDEKGTDTIVMNTVSNLYTGVTLPSGAPKVMKSAYDSRLNRKMGNMSRSDIVNGKIRTNLQIPTESKVNGVAVNSLSMPSLTSISMPSVNGNSFVKKEQEQRQREQQRQVEIEKERAKRELLDRKKAEFAMKQKQRKEQAAAKEREQAAREREQQMQMEEARRLAEQDAMRKKIEEGERQRRELEMQKLKEQQRREKQLQEIRKTNATILSNELLGSFLNEIVQQTILEEIATATRNRNLKKFCVKRIVETAAKCRAEYEKKQRKIDEFLRAEEMNKSSLKIRAKRAVVINNVMNNERLKQIKVLSSRRENDDMLREESQKIAKIQNEIDKRAENKSDITEHSLIAVEDKIPLIQRMEKNAKELWKPLNLTEIVSGFLKRKTSVYKDLSIILMSSDWSSLSASWIKAKFDLHPNVTANSLENKVTNGIDATFSTYREDLFDTTVCIIFECGFNDPNSDYSTSATQKLTDDAKLLLRAADLVGSRSNFKFQVVLLFWRDARVKISEIDIYNLMQIDKLKKQGKSTLLDVKFCPLDLIDDDPHSVDNTIKKCLCKMAKHFKGDLTFKGESKYKPKEVNDTTVDANPNHSNSTRLWNFGIGDSMSQANVELENSIIEQHPYFRKYRSHSRPVSRNVSRNSSFSVKTILPFESAGKNVAKRTTSVSVMPNKRQKISQDTSQSDNILAQSSMVNFSSDNLKTYNSFLNRSAIENDTEKTETTADHSTFEIMNSRFNRYKSSSLMTSNRNTFKMPVKVSSQSLRSTKPTLLTRNKAVKYTAPKRETVKLSEVPSSLAHLKSLVSRVNSTYKK